MIATSRFDVVAVSGDLSQRARPGEFQAARQLLRDAAKVSHTIVVPGNHDVKWWRAPLGVGSRASAIANYVIVMHHNPLRGELSNRYGLSHPARAAKAFVDLEIDLVLCGHDHQEAVHHVEHTKYGTVVCTAGTVSNRTRGQRPSAMNVVTLTQQALEVEPQIWSTAAQNFLPGPVKRFAR